MVFSKNARDRTTKPGLRNMAAVCLYLAQPSQANPPNPLLEGMALVLQRHYASAIPILEQVYRETPPANDGDIRALLAWTYLEARQDAAARPLVDLYPLIFPTPDSLFAGFTFPKFLRARAEVLKAEHNGSEARQMQHLADLFGGDVPDQF